MGSEREPALDWRRILTFWLVTRIWLSAWALFCSAQYPRTPLEQSVPIWPPSRPPLDWLARITLGPWNRWDLEYFLKIASHGYQAEDGTLTFHPLFPLLGRIAGFMTGGRYELGFFLVGNICALLFLLCLFHLIRIDLSTREAHRAVFYFTLLPGAFILFAPYTESLFLLCSGLAFLMARRGRWWLAGAAGGLAALTRQQGIFLLLPLVWEVWESAGKNWRSLLQRKADLIGLLLTPVGLLLWIVYRGLVLGDIAIDPSRPNTLIYGLLISRNATKLVTEQSLVMPWKAIYIAASNPNSANLIDLISGGVYLVLLIAGWRRLKTLRMSYLLYSLVVVLASFSLTTGQPYSYMGLPRHCLLAFPLVIAAAVWGRKTAINALITIAGLAWLFAMTLFYVCKILWIP